VVRHSRPTSTGEGGELLNQTKEEYKIRKDLTRSLCSPLELPTLSLNLAALTRCTQPLAPSLNLSTRCTPTLSLAPLFIVFRNPEAFRSQGDTLGEFGSELRVLGSVKRDKRICQMPVSYSGSRLPPYCSSPVGKPTGAGRPVPVDRSTILTFVDFEFRVNSTILLLDLEFEVELVWSSSSSIRPLLGLSVIS